MALGSFSHPEAEQLATWSSPRSLPLFQKWSACRFFGLVGDQEIKRARKRIRLYLHGSDSIR
jgi:hypothetical protein